MGIEVYVLNGRNYFEDRRNLVYHVTYAVHNAIVEKVPLVGEFVSMCDKPNKIISPARFTPFIKRFEEARQRLEAENLRNEEVHISAPHQNLGTYYDKVSQIIAGLSRAKELSKPISIDGVC
jgi:adenylylsulfate kinase-like enzyme